MKVALTSDLHRGASQKTHKIHDKFFDELEQDKSWDVLLIAGDLAISKTEQMESLFAHLRKYISRPILVIRGNHDYWHKDRTNSEYRGTRELTVCDTMHKQYFKTYDIHHLEGNPYVKDDVAIIGWDGWYTLPLHIRGTNDHEWMPLFTDNMDTERWLLKKATRDENRIVDEIDLHADKKIVLVNHMPIIYLESLRHIGSAIPGLWDIVKDKIKVYCYGHVHQKNDDVYEGIRIYSADVDYDVPGYLVFNVS